MISSDLYPSFGPTFFEREFFGEPSKGVTYEFIESDNKLNQPIITEIDKPDQPMTEQVAKPFPLQTKNISVTVWTKKEITLLKKLQLQQRSVEEMADQLPNKTASSIEIIVKRVFKREFRFKIEKKSAAQPHPTAQVPE